MKVLESSISAHIAIIVVMISGALDDTKVENTKWERRKLRNVHYHCKVTNNLLTAISWKKVFKFLKYLNFYKE